MHGNVNEDNFYDCFRCWEIRSLGVKEDVLRVLSSSKTPKLQAVKANKRKYREVIGKGINMSCGGKLCLAAFVLASCRMFLCCCKWPCSVSAREGRDGLKVNRGEPQ